MVVLTQSARAGGALFPISPNALLLAQPGPGAQAGAEALELAGYRAAARFDLDTAISALGDPIAFDLILIEGEGVEPALLEDTLSAAARAAQARDAQVVAAIGIDQIDLAAAYLLDGGGTLLCTPGSAGRVCALIAARGGARSHLNDVTRDPEAVRLRRLNEEVARIADTLQRLTRGEAAVPMASVRDSGSGYRGSEDMGGAVDATAQEIRAVIRARRLRAQFFASDLFADPAWDMLLDLYAAGLEKRQVSVSSLCIAAAVPPTTALRWIGTMHDAELFERQDDPSDRRRAYIGLSAKGVAGMRGYIAAARRQGLPLA